MHHLDVKFASVHGCHLVPPPPAKTRFGAKALTWEKRVFHRPPFSLSAPLLARILGREWEENEEGRERPRAPDRDGAVLKG